MRAAVVLLMLGASIASARPPEPVPGLPELVPRVTRWPVALPCERFVAADFYVSHDLDLTWSGAHATRTLALRRDEGSHEPVRVALDAGFPVGAVDRVALHPRVAAGPRELSLGIHLLCYADDAVAGVWWGQGAVDGLAVVYERSAPAGELLPAILAEPADALRGAGRNELARFAVEQVARAGAALSDACDTARCAPKVRSAAERLVRLRSPWRIATVRSDSEQLFPGLQHRGWAAELISDEVTLTLACGVDVADRHRDGTTLTPACHAKVTDHGKMLVDLEASMACDRFPVQPGSRCLWGHHFRFTDGAVAIVVDPRQPKAMITISGAAVSTRK